MTVKDLITVLSGLDQNLQIYYDNTPLASTEAHFRSIDEVNIITTTDDKFISLVSATSVMPTINLN